MKKTNSSSESPEKNAEMESSPEKRTSVDPSSPVAMLEAMK